MNRQITMTIKAVFTLKDNHPGFTSKYQLIAPDGFVEAQVDSEDEALRHLKSEAADVMNAEVISIEVSE